MPEELLSRLDQLAADTGTSRNRLIVECVRELLARHRDQWPQGYLDGTHLHPEDERLLEKEAEAFAAEIESARRSRREAPF